MREGLEVVLKKNRNWISRKKDGEKGLAYLLLSCFSSLGVDCETSTKDEVLKPLYYIVGDFNSEQMEATVESIDDESIDKKAKIDTSKSLRQAHPRRMDFLLSRFFRGILCRCKKKREVEIVSVRLTSPIRTNETESNERATTQRLDTIEKTSLSDYHAPNVLRLLSLYLSRCTKKHDSHSFPSKISLNNQNSQLEIKEENSDSDDLSLLRPNALGVTFAHPVYTGKCHLLMDEARIDTTNHLGTKMKTGLSVEIDDCPPVPMKKIVETTTAESWGSGGSLSLYPTDEQSNEDANMYYGSFDSDVDIPFDEIFTDKSFFEYDRN